MDQVFPSQLSVNVEPGAFPGTARPTATQELGLTQETLSKTKSPIVVVAGLGTTDQVVPSHDSTRGSSTGIGSEAGELL
jgi:hypothetical protein